MRTWCRLFHAAEGRAPARKYRSPATGNISGIYRLALTQVLVRKVGIYRGLVRNNSGHKDVGSSGYCARPFYARHLNIDFTEATCWRLRQGRAGLCSLVLRTTASSGCGQRRTVSTDAAGTRRVRIYALVSGQIEDGVCLTTNPSRESAEHRGF